MLSAKESEDLHDQSHEPTVGALRLDVRARLIKREDASTEKRKAELVEEAAAEGKQEGI
jgi:hypothetical protein